MGYLDDRRKKMSQQAQKTIDKSANSGIEFRPNFQKVKVRLLPPKDLNDLFPYVTAAYHYDLGGSSNPNKKGEYLFAPRTMSNGEKCPWDVAADELFNTGDEKDKLLGSKVKRKRQYLFHILLVDEPDPEKKLRILVDTSTKGQLAKQICVTAGIPFYHDLDDEWLDQTTADIDEDKAYHDLFDMDNGYDFVISKTKGSRGEWDIDYSQSYPVKQPRPLTDEERELAEKRIDLKTYRQKIDDFDLMQNKLNAFIDRYHKNGGEENSAPVAHSAKASGDRASVSENDLMDQMDADDFDDDDDI